MNIFSTKRGILMLVGLTVAVVTGIPAWADTELLHSGAWTDSSRWTQDVPNSGDGYVKVGVNYMDGDNAPTLSISPGDVVSGGVNLYLGWDLAGPITATIDMSGGTLSGGNLLVGGNHSAIGVVNHSGGTVSLSGGLYVGNSGTGNYTMSGSSALTTPLIYIGYYGAGTVTQNGGTITITGDQLQIGYQTPGAYALNSGLLDASGRTVYIGNSGAGTVTQAGGTANFGTLQLGYNTVSSYTLSGNGVMNVADFYKPTGGSTFTFSGGTLSADHLRFEITNTGGTLAPGRGNTIGITYLHANYANGASGTVQIQLASSGSYDTVNASGYTVTLNGNLTIARVGGFEPQSSDSFTILSATTVSGTFANAATSGQRYNLGGGSFVVTYNAGSVVLSGYQAVSADTTPPIWDATPTADTPTSDGFTVHADINEAGTAYYVVLASGAPAPGASDVKTHGGSPLAYGSMTLATGLYSGSAPVTGLNPGTDYDVYVVAEDDESPPNLQADGAVQKVTVQTAAVDTTAPTWDAAPTADTPTSDGFTVHADINEAGTAYYVVLASGAPAPGASDVKTHGGSPLAYGSMTLATGFYSGSAPVTGLSPDTDYDVYFVAEDDESPPNLQADGAVQKADVQTALPPAPAEAYLHHSGAWTASGVWTPSAPQSASGWAKIGQGYTGGDNAPTVSIGVGDNVSGGQNLAVGRDLVGPITATINMSGGTLSGGYMSVGDNNNANGVVNQTGGAVTLSGNLVIGQSGCVGSYSLGAGSSLSVQNVFYVGNSGSGTLSQSGGSITISGGEFQVGLNGPGTYTLSDGVLNATAPGTYIGNGAAGTVAQSGGTANFGTVQLGYTTVSSYTLSGGVMNVATLNKPTGGSTFTLSGGTLSADTVSFDLTNTSGTLAPGRANTTGKTQVNGTYANGAGATVQIQLGGTGQGTTYDWLNASGVVTLNGNLTVALVNGFTPVGGDVFTVVTGISVSGTFVNAPASGSIYDLGGSRFVVTYNPGSVVLHAVYPTVIMFK